MSEFLDRLIPICPPPQAALLALQSDPGLMASYGALFHRAGPEVMSSLLSFLRRWRDVQVQETVAGRVTCDPLVLTGIDKAFATLDVLVVKCVTEYEKRAGIDLPLSEDSTVPGLAQARHTDLFGDNQPTRED